MIWDEFGCEIATDALRDPQPIASKPGTNSAIAGSSGASGVRC